MNVFFYANISEISDYDNQEQIRKQKTIDLFAEYAENNTPLSIKKTNSIKLGDYPFDIYSCVNDNTINKNGYVIVNLEEDFTEKPFNVYYEKMNFDLYFNKTDRMALLNTSTDTAMKFIRKINNHNSFEYPVRDLKKLISKLENVSGVSIQKINEKNIKSLSLRGPEVDDSDLYNKYKDAELSSVSFLYDHKTVVHNIMVTKKGAFIFYTNARWEDQLEILIDLINKLK